MYVFRFISFYAKKNVMVNFHDSLSFSPILSLANLEGLNVLF